MFSDLGCAYEQEKSAQFEVKAVQVGWKILLVVSDLEPDKTRPKNSPFFDIKEGLYFYF